MDKKEQLAHIESYLCGRFQLAPEQVAEMIPSFIQTLSQHLKNLENALDGQSLNELGKAGHTIKGALLNLGLMESAEIAREIEVNGKAENDDVDYAAMVGEIRLHLSPLFQ